MEHGAARAERSGEELIADVRARLVRLLDALADDDVALAYEIAEELELDLTEAARS